jgi:hypothetical protein
MGLQNKTTALFFRLSSWSIKVLHWSSQNIIRFSKSLRDSPFFFKSLQKSLYCPSFFAHRVYQQAFCILYSFRDSLSTKVGSSTRTLASYFDGDGAGDWLRLLANFSEDSNSLVLQTSSNREAYTLSMKILLAATQSTKTCFSFRAPCNCCFAALSSMEHNWRSWLTSPDIF